MKRVWNDKNGFGNVVGGYNYCRVHYLRIRWDRDPWFVDDVPESEIEYCS